MLGNPNLLGWVLRSAPSCKPLHDSKSNTTDRYQQLHRHHHRHCHHQQQQQQQQHSSSNKQLTCTFCPLPMPLIRKAPCA